MKANTNPTLMASIVAQTDDRAAPWAPEAVTRPDPEGDVTCAVPFEPPDAVSRPPESPVGTCVAMAGSVGLPDAVSRPSPSPSPPAVSVTMDMVMVYVMSPMDWDTLLGAFVGATVVMTTGLLVTVTCDAEAEAGGAAAAGELGLPAVATHLASTHCCMSWLSTSWLFCLEGVRLRM